MITREMRDEIRERYNRLMPRIMRKPPLSPYAVFDWTPYFTPIEDEVWAAIRYVGAPMYPQFPIGPYFADFADPWRKLVIEADGKEWHQDRAADTKRERHIESLGWRVFRFRAPTMFRIREDFEDQNGYLDYERYRRESVEGFLWDIYWEGSEINRLNRRIA
jgi:hypothetical protein